jgi:osmoprotectant transport system permease protein
LLVFLASLYPLTGTAGTQVVIGAKNFDEQYTLSALIMDRLARAGIPASRRSGLGSNILFRALAAGDIDVYVDYSGTIWANQMHRSDSPGRAEVLQQTARWLEAKYGILDLGPLGFENAYVLAMRSDRAKALGIHTLADLAPYAPRLRIGGDYEFFSRPEWSRVAAAYGISFLSQRVYQPTFMYRALRDGDVDVIAAFSSDGRILEHRLTLLSDPKSALPPYDAILLISPKHARDTELIRPLRALIGKLDLALMQRANLMLDRDKRTPEDVAKWLADHIR